MPGQRRTNLVRRRRRTEDDGDDNASVATEHMDDSASEASAPSDADVEADDSDVSDSGRRTTTANGNSSQKVDAVSKQSQTEQEISKPDTAVVTKTESGGFAPTSDTDVMMNGFKIPEDAAHVKGVDFETPARKEPSVSTQPVIVSSTRHESPIEKRRREAEEYRKKREADPAFIPNRGEFFMHDHRAHAGQNGMGPMRGRGRGRGGIGRPFGPPGPPLHSNEPMNNPWAHDLHDSLLEQEQHRQSHQHGKPKPNIPNIANALPPSKASNPAQPAPTSIFNTTKIMHKVLIRVSLPGMQQPKTFADVPIHLYARLPNHRPPLRRDKPVRVSLPERPPRYIFPSVERSFIFIPRALRPNQQGFGARRGRGFGSMGGFSSRRTSVYGGSVYSPSVAASRRSSLARDITRDGLVSPTGSVASRMVTSDPSKPIVRLPIPASVGPPLHPAANGFPPMGVAPPMTYPLPQKPTFQTSSALPMHQPRPQKQVSVAGIENPVDTFTAPQQQEQRPFHQQVPAHMSEAAGAGDVSQYTPHTRQLSYPSQPSTGTPLSHIPERAIHAQPFQPFQQPGFGAPSYQPGYYYPNPAGAPMSYGPVMQVPMYVQNGQPGSFVPPAVPTSMPMPVGAPNQAQPGMMAHEANGTVYYYDQSSMYGPPNMGGYSAPSYAVPGMGGMMTPSPDGYYYPQMQPTGTVYYTQPQ